MIPKKQTDHAYESMKESGGSDEALKLTRSQSRRMVSPMKQTDYESMRESGESDEAN